MHSSRFAAEAGAVICYGTSIPDVYRQAGGYVGRILLQEGIARGELPAWLDVDGLATAYSAMLDGLTLVGIEEGAGYRRADAERRAAAVLELLLAAASAPKPQRVAIPSEPYVPAWFAGGVPAGRPS